MIDIPVATDPETVSPEWLTGALQTSGTISEDMSVENFTFEPIGTGQVSNSFRVTPTWSSAGQGPKSFVFKVPSHDEASRTVGASIYNVEVNFYQTFAPKLPIRTPKCHFAGIADNDLDFILVLEDMAPATQGDQMEGCTLDQARTAIREITKLHAPTLNDPSLKGLEWLGKAQTHSADFRPMLQELYKGFRERYDGLIEPEIMAMCDRYYGRITELSALADDPFCLVHSDYRVDNILFASEQGGEPITVVDWQTTTVASPLRDVSYFIGAGLHVEERRTHEEDLVRLYHDTMAAAGVTELTWEKCWELYRVNSFSGLTTAVISAIIVERTERGDEMFRTMARRHGQQILDLDAEALLS